MSSIHFYILVLLMSISTYSQNLHISELMIDPTPMQGLPDAEYIELWNSTNAPLNFTTLVIGDRSKRATIPNFSIEKNAYVIICAEKNQQELAPYGTCIGISGFPTLNNDSDSIWIADTSGMLIDYLRYDNNWFRTFNTDGGFSLELIDSKQKCLDMQNWGISKNSDGGTPGRQNSLHLEHLNIGPPLIVNSTIINNNSIKFHFNQAVFSENAQVFYSNDTSPERLSFSTSINNYDIILELPAAVNKHQAFSLTLKNFKNCIGMDSTQTIRIAIPDTIRPHSLVFNEVLFHDTESKSEYFEIINRSGHAINLKGTKVVIRNALLAVKDTIEVFNYTKLMYPNQLFCFARNTSLITETYANVDTTNLFQRSMPSFNNDGGSIIFLDSNNRQVDIVSYYENDHHPQLASPAGVSLERINPNYLGDQHLNWHSASSMSNYGTPTSKNSQLIENQNVTGSFKLSTNVITPDNDGINDLLSIEYDLNHAGYIGDIIIFDLKGNYIKHLISHKLLDARGQISWLGTNDAGVLVGSGVYLIVAYLFHYQLDSLKFKDLCVVHNENR